MSSKVPRASLRRRRERDSEAAHRGRLRRRWTAARCRRPLVLLGREPQWLSGAARPRARRHGVAKGHQSIPRANVGFAGSEIVFDQMEIEHQVGLQSDLYAVATSGGHSRRLTHGARAADPDVSPDGRVIVCTTQRVGRRELALLDVATASTRPVPTPLVSQPGVHFFSPRWSPDGRWIAAERTTMESRSEVVLIDPATKRVARTVGVLSRQPQRLARVGCRWSSVLCVRPGR